MRLKQTWVAEEFHRMLKKEGAEQGKSIAEYTKELAKRGDPLAHIFGHNNDKKRKKWYIES